MHLCFSLEMFNLAFLILVAMLSFERCQVFGSCPSGWTQGDRKCYLLVKQKKSWDEAFSACLQQNAHLLFIERASDNNKVQEILQASPECTIPWLPGLGTWTAGHKRVGNDFCWQAAGGAKYQMCYTNWRSGEPNNYESDEDCIHLYEDLTWNDLACGKQLCFMCEIDI